MGAGGVSAGSFFSVPIQKTIELQVMFTLSKDKYIETMFERNSYQLSLYSKLR
jgi:hypothetical protein